MRSIDNIMGEIASEAAEEMHMARMEDKRMRDAIKDQPTATPEPASEPRPHLRDDGIPTRNDLSRMTMAERAILYAVRMVEAAGASKALTDAVVLLQQARERVADHVEGRAEPVSDGPWLVVICREGVSEVTLFDDEAEAVKFYDQASAQWSDSYLCVARRWPKDVHTHRPARPASDAAKGGDEALWEGEVPSSGNRLQLTRVLALLPDGFARKPFWLNEVWHETAHAAAHLATLLRESEAARCELRELVTEGNAALAAEEVAHEATRRELAEEKADRELETGSLARTTIRLVETEQRAVKLEDALAELYFAVDEESLAAIEANLLTPNSSYDEAEASSARVRDAEKRLDEANGIAEGLIAHRLAERTKEPTK